MGLAGGRRGRSYSATSGHIQFPQAVAGPSTPNGTPVAVTSLAYFARPRSMPYSPPQGTHDKSATVPQRTIGGR